MSTFWWYWYILLRTSDTDNQTFPSRQIVTWDWQHCNVAKFKQLCVKHYKFNLACVKQIKWQTRGMSKCPGWHFLCHKHLDQFLTTEILEMKVQLKPAMNIVWLGEFRWGRWHKMWTSPNCPAVRIGLQHLVHYTMWEEKLRCGWTITSLEIKEE